MPRSTPRSTAGATLPRARPPRAVDPTLPSASAHYLSVPDPEMANIEAVDESLSPPIVAARQRPARREPADDRPDGRRRFRDGATGPADAPGSGRVYGNRQPRSTAQEREAAVAWLEAAARDEHQVARLQATRQPAVRRPRAVRRPTRNDAATPTTVTASSHASAPLAQLEALRRQQSCILHSSALIDYVLAAERRGGDPLTDGRRAGRAARRHHRGGAHDRDPAANRPVDATCAPDAAQTKAARLLPPETAIRGLAFHDAVSLSSGKKARASFLGAAGSRRLNVRVESLLDCKTGSLRIGVFVDFESKRKHSGITDEPSNLSRVHGGQAVLQHFGFPNEFVVRDRGRQNCLRAWHSARPAGRLEPSPPR